MSVWSLFVFVPCRYGRVTVDINGDTQNERPTTHLAILDIFLVAQRMIDDNADRLTAIRTVKGFLSQ